MQIREISRAETINKMDAKLVNWQRLFDRSVHFTSKTEHFVVKCRGKFSEWNFETNEHGFCDKPILTSCFYFAVAQLYYMILHDGWKFNSRWRLLNGNLISLRALCVPYICERSFVFLCVLVRVCGHKACAHLDRILHFRRDSMVLSFIVMMAFYYHRLRCQPCAFGHTRQLDVNAIVWSLFIRKTNQEKMTRIAKKKVETTFSNNKRASDRERETVWWTKYKSLSLYVRIVAICVQINSIQSAHAHVLPPTWA